MSDYDYDNAVFRLATAQEAEPEDYTGEDGLLYCGKCRQPKEAFNIIYTQIGLEFFLYTHMGCFVYLLT